MDFLLECIGFPPDYRLEPLIERVVAEGEPSAWRGAPEHHLRLDLGSGLEVRIDRANAEDPWNVLPHFRARRRLRIAVQGVRGLPDSPFDALLVGWAEPPIDRAEQRISPGAFRITTFLTDARRLPARMLPGHVLALSIAGFALDVDYVGPNLGVRDPAILERESGASIEPLGGEDDPGGCAEVSMRIQEVRHAVNSITGVPVDVLVTDCPGRPLELFVSRWQLEKDGLPQPRPGWRIEGTFLFSGRIAGGLAGPRRSARGAFG